MCTLASNAGNSVVEYVVIGSLSLGEPLLSEDHYDFTAMHQRALKAIRKLNKDIPTLLKFMGRNPELPMDKEPAIKPTVGNIAKVSRFLGVSAHWILTGEAENEVDFYVTHGGPVPAAVSDDIAVLPATPNFAGPAVSAPGSADLGNVSGGSVLQGVTAGNITVQNFSPGGLSRTETEVIEILRRLPPRQKSEALAFLLSLDCVDNVR